MKRMDEYMREDGRNPYGSRGGYVSGRRPRRDRASEYDDGYDRAGYDREYDGRYDYSEDSRYRDERDYNYDERSREYRGYFGDNPFYLEQMDMPYDMRRGRDYRVGRGMTRGMFRGGRRDYESHNMTAHDVEEWKEKLYRQLDDSDKESFKIEKIIKRASENRVDFSKFTEDEFYVTVLMMYTDYKNTLGKGNVDIYIRLAKDFLCDEDASVKYGEKLAVYYEEIVM